MKGNKLQLQFVYMVGFIIFCFAFVSCGDKKKSVRSDTTKPPPSFNQTSFLEVTPLCDGSAYAKSFGSGFWYLHGNKAVKVVVLSDASQQLPEFDEITPILEGGAYATCLTESGLWYLHGQYAEKVNEVSSMEIQTNSRISGNAFYALYIAEHKKHKTAEDAINNPPEPPDYSDNY